MARTETFTKLLDRCSTPVQTHLILAQLALLRRQDKARVKLNEQGMSTLSMLAMLVAMTFIWTAVARVIAISIGTWLPFGH